MINAPHNERPSRARRALTTMQYLIIAGIGAGLTYGAVAYTGQKVQCLIDETGFHVSQWSGNDDVHLCGNAQQQDILYWTQQGSASAPISPMPVVYPGRAYQEAIPPAVSTSGSTVTYTLQKTVNGDMPSQLVFDPATGVLVTSGGTVPMSDAGKSFTMVVTAQDALGNHVSSNYITVNIQSDMIAWEQSGNPFASASGTPGQTYSQALKADSTLYNAIAYNLINGTLPAGLNYSPQNALGTTGMTITGTPSICPAAQSQTVTFRATDGYASPADLNVLIPVLNDKLVWSDGLFTNDNQRLPSYIPGQPYSADVAYAISTIDLSVTQNFDAALPTGLSYDPTTHIISGTVPINQRPAGDTTVEFTANDASCSSTGVQLTSSRPITIPQLPDAITWNESNPFAMQEGKVGQAYNVSAPIATSAWKLGVTYSITSGSLPPGLTYNPSTDMISGTPNDAKGGTYTIVLQGTDGYATSTITTSIYIVPDILTWDDNSTSLETLSGYTPNTAYNSNLVDANSSLNYNVSYSIGAALTNDLNYNSSGNDVSGTPDYTVGSDGNIYTTVTATDGYATITRQVKIPRVPDVITWSYTNLANGHDNQAYNQTLNRASSLYQMPITYAITSGNLPAGLSMNSDGTISGTPTSDSTTTATFTVTATDGIANASENESITIIGDTITWNDGGASGSNESVASGRQGTAYSQNMVQATSDSGFTVNYTYGTVTPPPGLSMYPTYINGTPTTSGTWSYTVTAYDGHGANITRTFSIYIAPDVITWNDGGASGSSEWVASGQQEKYYDITLVGATSNSGYTVNYTFGNASPPPGMSWDGEHIYGTPTQSGTWNYTITAYDGQGANITRTFSIYIAPDVITWNDGGASGSSEWVPGGTQGRGYNQNMVGATSNLGNTIYYTYNGSAPPGMYFSGLTIGGTPTQGGTWYYTITAYDNIGSAITRNFTIIVNPDNLTWNDGGANGSNEGVAGGQVNQGYSQNLVGATSSAGYGVNYYYSGNAPPGMNFNGLTIGGTPTSGGTWSYTITAYDNIAGSITRNFTITIKSNLYSGYMQEFGRNGNTNHVGDGGGGDAGSGGFNATYFAVVECRIVDSNPMQPNPQWSTEYGIPDTVITQTTYAARCKNQ